MIFPVIRPTFLAECTIPLGNQKLITHNGHKDIQEEREVGLFIFVSGSANHITCTIQLNPQTHEYTFISRFHNHNQCPNQWVVCDHCAQLSSVTYLVSTSHNQRWYCSIIAIRITTTTILSSIIISGNIPYNILNKETFTRCT